MADVVKIRLNKMHEKGNTFSAIHTALMMQRFSSTISQGFSCVLYFKFYVVTQLGK